MCKWEARRMTVKAEGEKVKLNCPRNYRKKREDERN